MKGELQREAILDALRGTPRGLDTNQLAAQLHIHPNTVRWHIGLLEGRGLVHAAPELRHGRGRPSVVYRLTSEGAAGEHDGYRFLATMLTELVANDADGEHHAYETGRQWGRDLHEAEPGASVAELLDHEGFAATDGPARIEMRRCPFAALALRAPQVICTLHRGLIDGAYAAAGADTTVEELVPFAEPGLCLARLRAS